jgi:hypothetical protein
MKILKYACILAFQKRSSFCLKSFEKTLSFAFHQYAYVREIKFLFIDAWAIAEAYVVFCVGFTYTPQPAVL